jgi:hypothetical protein
MTYNTRLHAWLQINLVIYEVKLSTKTVTASLLLIMILVSLPLTWARSPNNCSACHGSSQQQYLDLLESSAATSIPVSLGVGETKSVSVAIQNICSATRYTALSGVQVTLSSNSGLIKVTNPTFNIGQLPVGTKVATWTITGLATGTDSLVISATATNNHNNVQFSDSFSTTPSISVTSGNVKLSISVTDSSNGSALDGVSVSLGSTQQLTDASGVATLSVTPGTYQLSISKNGYASTTESLIISSSTKINRSLKPLSVTTYAIKITTRDNTGVKIAGVAVQLGSFQAITDVNGEALIQAAAGNYTTILTKTGYNPLAQDVIISSAKILSFIMSQSSNANYTLTITVNDGASSKKLSNSSVILSGTEKVTDNTGMVTFSVKSGTYNLEINRVGYIKVSEIISISGDTSISEYLSLAQPQHFILTVTVVDDGQQKIAYANVTVDKLEKVTNLDGIAYFTLDAGYHQLIINKNGYSSFNETISLTRTENITRNISQLPVEPAQDWTPFMIFIHPPLAILSYVFTFTFAAYIFLPGDRAKALTRIAYISWGLTLAALLTGMLWAQNAWGNYWSWEPKETTTLALFILISATIMAYNEGRTNLARILSLASCIPILLVLPNVFMLVGFGFLLLVVAIRSDQIGEREKKQSTLKSISVKINRFTSWVFLISSLLTLLSGYVMTRFGLLTSGNLNIHSDFAYIFGAMLALHVALSLLSGYPWRRIILSLFEKRNAMIIALNLQETTAFLLLVLGSVQFFTGLGYINIVIASIVPKGIHTQLNGLLLYSLLIHGVVGLRAVMQRNRVKIPGGDIFYILLGVILLVFISYLKP